MINSIVSYLYYGFFHRVFKWFLRIVTGKCELLRIAMSPSSLAMKTFKIESSLRRSKLRQLNKVIAEVVNVDAAVNEIISAKVIDVDRFPSFPIILKTSISQIVGYRQLILDVEILRNVTYSSNNTEHESLLSQLWHSLQPDVPLPSRTGRHWTDIGFQGEDPATDFRGMGLLGLRNLLYLCTRYSSIARKLFSHSNHPQFGYSFAIVGINLTALSFKLLREGHLKSHFYNSVNGSPQIDDFNEVYVYIFYNFDAFWLAEEPEDIMQFNVVKEKFYIALCEQLQLRTAQFRLNV